MTKESYPYGWRVTERAYAMDPEKIALMEERNKKLVEMYRLSQEMWDMNKRLGFDGDSIYEMEHHLLSTVGFSIRALNGLRNGGFRFLKEVDIATDEELLSIPNLGKTTLREIRETVAFHLTERFPNYKQHKGEKT
jgi:DNA-directed RNA polymerase alpha subunit